MIAISAKTARGSKLYLNSAELDQVEMLYIDHATARLRARLIYTADSATQIALRNLAKGKLVWIALEIPGEEKREWMASLGFCRTRFCATRVIRTTVVFELVDGVTYLAWKRDIMSP